MFKAKPSTKLAPPAATGYPAGLPPAQPAAPLPPPAPPPRAKHAGVPSIVASGMAVQGNFRSDGDLQIDGSVNGDVTVAALAIAPGGSLAGNASAASVRIAGRFSGTVRGKSVTITATGQVEGDIYSDLLTIETGGLLDGCSRRLSTAPAEAAPLSLSVNTNAAEPAFTAAFVES